MEKASSPSKLISWVDYSLFHASDLNWVKGSIAIGLTIHGLALRGMVEFTQPSGLLYVLVHSGQAVGAFLALLVLAPPLFQELIDCWHCRKASVEVGLLVGVLILFFTSLTASIRLQSWAYYEVIPLVLTLYAASRYWLGRKKRMVATALPVSYDRAERCNRVESNGAVTRMPLTDLKVGDEIKISTSQVVPVDGVVVTGEGYVSEASLNGARFPIVKQPGDPILAGSVSLDGIFTVKALSPYLPRKMQPVVNPLLAPGRDGSCETLFRSTNKRSTMWISLLCVAGFTVGWLQSGLYPGLITVATILILGSTLSWISGVPVHFWTSLTHLAKHGFYGKEPELISRLASVDRAFFDKTGVLTRDQLELSRFFVMPAFQDREDWIKSLVFQTSRSVHHPLTNPLSAVGSHIQGEPVTEDLTYKVVPGFGIEANLTDGLGEKLTLRIGEAPFVLSQGTEARLSAVLTEHDLLEGHHIWFSLGGRVCAVAVLKEDWNVPPQPFFAQLEYLGITSSILTGDVAFNDSRLNGLDYHLGLSARDKQQQVERESEGKSTLYVGDGLNDYRAMASSDISVAMNHAPESVLNLAHAVLAPSNLQSLIFAIRYCRRIIQLTERNKWTYLLMTTLISGAAIVGWLNPMLAALFYFLGFLGVWIQELMLSSSSLSDQQRSPNKRTRRLQVEELFAPRR